MSTGIQIPGPRAVRAVAAVAGPLLALAALSAPADAGDGAMPAPKAAQKLSASLNGANEVPGPGDPNGTGRVALRLKPAAGTVCATATWRRIGEPVAAHIHAGAAGVGNGAVVVDLTGSVTGGANCATGVERRVIRKLIAHPKRYYFNIHTGAYPAGAIRGQLRTPR